MNNIINRSVILATMVLSVASLSISVYTLCALKGKESPLMQGIITGYVKGASDGKSIFDATITYSGVDKGSEKIQPDNNNPPNAFYSTKLIASSNTPYRVMANAPGYIPSSALVLVKGGKVAKQDFSLNKESNPTHKERLLTVPTQNK